MRVSSAGFFFFFFLSPSTWHYYFWPILRLSDKGFGSMTDDAVRDAAILCLHAVEVRHTAPPVDSIHLSSVLVSSLFNVWAAYVSSSDRVSTLRPLRPCLKSQTAQAVSQVLDHVLTSNYALRLCDQLCDSWRNEMYIEREAHPVF